MDGCSWRVLELEVEVVDGASPRPVREEEQDAQQDCGGEERCDRPHEVYAARSRLRGPRHFETLRDASNISDLMITSHLWAEAKQFLSEQIPIFQDVNGLDDKLTLKMRWRYALVHEYEGKRTEAVAILEDVERR